MSKKMLIDAGHPEETRVVVVDGSRVDEFDFESQSKRQLRGNIYLARVTRVEPSLQAAFVEYGGNRHGFLAFSEIHPDYYQIPFEDRKQLLEDERRAASEAAKNDERLGDGEPAVDEDGEPIVTEDDPIEEEQRDRQRRRSMRSYKIQEVIKRRQILLVQVVKEERGNKGAALTTYLSLAGRYCVLMPNTARGGGVSRKITSDTDRKRLKKVAAELDTPDGMGLIIRTAGAKRTKAEIKRDSDYLMRLWETIREQTLKSVAPCLIYEESNLVKRAIRDLYDKDIDAVLVEGDAAYREAKDFIRMLMPSHAKKVQHYRDPTPLFTREKVENQLEQIFDPTVQLKSGGYLVINQTEALVAIDVNSGRATRERNIEATALKTNMEAAEEACRQFRLRDLAGLLVIDFIDMDESKNNRAVEKVMRDNLKRDRARVQAGKISSFGLMELSRQRRRASVLEGSHSECPTCRGRGLVRSVESAALRVLRAIEEEGMAGKAKLIRVRTDPRVAIYLLNEKRDSLNAIEQRYGMRALIAEDPALIPPELEIERVEERTADDPAPTAVVMAPIVDARDAEDDAAAAEAAAADAAMDADAEAPSDSSETSESSESSESEGGERKRRRRRRGRGRGSREGGASDAPTAETTPVEEQAHDADGDADGEVNRAEQSGEASEGDEERPRRRRRRGRRGGRGRRPTEGTQTEGATSEAPSDEPDSLRVVDPEAVAVAAENAASDPAVATSETPAADTAATSPVEPAGDEDAPAEKKPRRAPRRRSRAKPAATETDEAAAQGEAPATTDPEPKDAEAEKPAPRRRRRTKAAKPAEDQVETASPVAETSSAAPAAEAPPSRAPRKAASKPAPSTPAPAAAPAATKASSSDDPEAEERRKRWQNRVKSWLGG